MMVFWRESDSAAVANKADGIEDVPIAKTKANAEVLINIMLLKRYDG